MKIGLWIDDTAACRNCLHWGQTYYGGPFGRCCNARLAEKPNGIAKAWEWPETFECEVCDHFRSGKTGVEVVSKPFWHNWFIAVGKEREEENE